MAYTMMKKHMRNPMYSIPVDFCKQSSGQYLEQTIPIVVVTCTLERAGYVDLLPESVVLKYGLFHAAHLPWHDFR